MDKKCVLFAGQGSQYQGMGLNLDADDIFSCGSDILGFDLKKLCETASMEELTVNAQPAIFAVSLAHLKKVNEKPDAFLGHSLGEYAALVASGILSLADGFKAIKARSYAMTNFSCGGEMYAIMGLDSNEIEETCKNIDGYVVPVNYNSPVQTVIAGESSAVAKAVEAFSGKAKRCIKLAVASAFHSKLMEKAADVFYDEIKDLEFKTPHTKFYSNVYGKELTDFSDMKGYLKKHIVSPVLFVDELNSLKNDGFTNFIECGPSKVLTGLVAKTLKDVSSINIEQELKKANI